MTTPENYSVIRQNSPGSTTAPFTVNLPYAVTSVSELDITLIRSDNGAVVSSPTAVLDSPSQVSITNTTGVVVEAVLKRVSDLSQDYDPSNQVANDWTALEASLDKISKAIQELKKEDGRVKSIDGFSFASALARADSYIKFDENGDPKLLDGVLWADIENIPTEFPPEDHTHPWSDITDTPSTFPPAAHTHPWSDITDTPSTFPPSSHTHEGETLGTIQSPVTLLNVDTISLQSVLKISKARIVPTPGGERMKFQVYDQVADSMVDVLEFLYDPNAGFPLETITLFTEGQMEARLGYLMGPEGQASTRFRTNESVPGSGNEDTAQFDIQGTQSWNFRYQDISANNPNATVGNDVAFFAGGYFREIVFGETNIREIDDQIVFQFPDPVSGTITDRFFFNHDSCGPANGINYNLGGPDNPFGTGYFTSLVITGDIVFSGNVTDQDYFRGAIGAAPAGGGAGGQIQWTDVLSKPPELTSFDGAGFGFISKIQTDGVAARTMTAGSGMTITDGDGVGGNPTFTVNNSLPLHTMTDGTNPVYRRLGTINGNDLDLLFGDVDVAGTAAGFKFDYTAALLASLINDSVALGDASTKWASGAFAGTVTAGKLVADGSGGIEATDGNITVKNHIFEAISYGPISAFTCKRALGTEGAPSAITNGKEIGRFQFVPYDGTGFNFVSGRMFCTATENHDATSGGAEYEFQTCANGSTTLVTRFKTVEEGIEVREAVKFAGQATAASMPNESLFIDDSNGKLSFKDSTGTTNALY